MTDTANTNKPFSCSSLTSFPTFVSITNNLTAISTDTSSTALSWSTTSVTDVKSYTISLNCKYGNVIPVYQTGSFTLSVICNSTITLSPLSYKIYSIASSAGSQTVSHTESPSKCGNIKTCTLDSSTLTNTPWITVSNCVISWYTTNTTVAKGNYTVTVIASCPLCDAST